MTDKIASNVANKVSSETEDSPIRRLYDLYYRPLCYFAKQLIGNQQEAEDISTDSILKLWDKNITDPQDAKSLVFTMVRNACVDVLRKRKIRNKYLNEFAFLFRNPKQEEIVDEEMIKAKVLQNIYSEAELLPSQCKVIFKSIFIDEKDTAVVAEEMGICRQTVLNQKTRALRILRSKLERIALFFL